MIELKTRTGRILIDTTSCGKCSPLACIKACSFYGSGILRLSKGIPDLLIDPEKASLRCIECLACEVACQIEGLDVLTIELPMPSSFIREVS